MDTIGWSSKTLRLLGCLSTVGSSLTLDFGMTLIHTWTFLVAPLLRAACFILKRVLQTVDHKSPFWGGGSGCQKKKGTYCLGQWHWRGRFLSLLSLCVRVLSHVTLVFFPAPGDCLQAVDFGDLQSSLWYYYFSSIGCFSRGEGNNFLKSIRMWRKAVCC